MNNEEEIIKRLERLDKKVSSKSVELYWCIIIAICLGLSGCYN